MLSKWYASKSKAILLRQKGGSIRDIEKSLGIPRSTLSGWFRNIQLTKEQNLELQRRWSVALIKARVKAVKWHHLQKDIRLEKARSEAISILKKIDTKDKSIIELSLAILYLGEGAKKNGTSLGSTDPLILKFFLSSIFQLYNIHRNKIKAELHIRQDQNGTQLMDYWSKILAIPLENFNYVADKRPIKTKTYENYNGVCVLRLGQIAIRRRLVFLSREFCNKIASADP